MIPGRTRGLLIVMLLVSCASPEARYYTLAAVPGTPVAGRAATIEVRRVGLAGYLDRPDIISRNGPFRLEFAPNARWAEPLGDMISRVLGEDLGQRLPGSSVFTESGAVSLDTETRVEVDIQRFDLDQTDTVTLLAQVAVEHQGGRRFTASRSVRLAAHPASGSIVEMAKTMSALLGRLADTIVTMLKGRATAN
jgi:uncharacterized lipoprotein YmbA